MPNGEVRVIGARRLRATLKGAGDDLSDMKAAHAEAGSIAADEARTRAPKVDFGLLGTIRSAGTKTAAIIRAGNNSTVKYAGPINWGWGARHIVSQPFLTGGAAASEPRWIRVYEAYINSALNQIKGL